MSLVIATEPSSIAVVFDQCSAIEAWAETCESVADLHAAAAKLSAVDAYLTRTSIEGRGLVARSMRRLEFRIGNLLGPAEPVAGPGRGKPSTTTDGLSRDQRSDFRQMAEHPDVVEDVIAGSTDDAPASRRKVMAAISLASAVARYPWIAGCPAPARQLIDMANALDAYEEPELSRRIENGKKWVAAQRRKADNPPAPDASLVAEKTVDHALTGLVTWNVDAQRALDAWDKAPSLDAMALDEWDAAARLATGHLHQIAALLRPKLRSVK